MKCHLALYRTGFAAFLLLSLQAFPLRAQHPLNSWARRPGLTTNLRGVAFGNDVFVAVGDESAVATSPDGVEWTASTAGSYGHLARVRFLNGQFVAVGSSDKILFSADGAAWTSATLPGTGNWDVAYGNGVYVVANSRGVFASSDASTWTSTPRSLDAVAFGNGVFVALPTRQQVFILPTAFSTNGVDWTSASSSPTGHLEIGRGEVVFGEGVFVAEAAQWSGLYTTSDGTSWCCGFTGRLNGEVENGGLAHGQGYFVWAGYGLNLSGYYPDIYSSANGTAWEARFQNGAVDERTDLKGRSRGAAFGHGTFVFVGDAGYIIQSGNLDGRPLITLQPQDRAAIVDNPASLSVQAVGSLPLAYQWLHNDVTITGATNAIYPIAHVQAADGGGYQVVITNSFGSVTSRVAQLSVSFLSIQAYAGLQILGVPGRTYRVEATPAAGPVNWQTLTNLPLPASPYIWIDFASPQAGQRLYRVAELP